MGLSCEPNASIDGKLAARVQVRFTRSKISVVLGSAPPPTTITPPPGRTADRENQRRRFIWLVMVQGEVRLLESNKSALFLRPERKLTPSKLAISPPATSTVPSERVSAIGAQRL